jgi:aspartate-semialdehyde dehydrogenase
MSNASNARLDPSVPLLIPEVNADALKLIEQQKSPGKWIKNPNCAAVAVAMGVAPLRRLPAWRQLSITSLQAISGAGFGAVPADLLCANVLPFISGEEEKIEAESRRLLALDPNVSLSVQVFRVPVLHGHTVSLHLRLAEAVTLDDVWNALEEQRQCFPESYVLYTDPKAPQPARHLGAYDQRAHIGQVKLSADGRVVSLLCLIHNLVRGAAGASLKNLEAYLAWTPCASLL